MERVVDGGGRKTFDKRELRELGLKRWKNRCGKKMDNNRKEILFSHCSFKANAQNCKTQQVRYK